MEINLDKNPPDPNLPDPESSSAYSSYHSSLVVAEDDIEGQRRQWVKYTKHMEKQQVPTKTYSQQVLDEVDQVFEELQKLPDGAISFRNLSVVPRKILKPANWPKMAEDLQFYWDQLKLIPKYTDRFASLTMVLLHYVDHDAHLGIKAIFDANVTQKHNRDLGPYIKYVKSGSVTSFELSAIENPIYADVPKGYKREFSQLRIVKVKKDLLDALLTTFSKMCDHRSLTNGIEFGMKELDDLSGSEDNDDDGWLGSYKIKKSADLHLIKKPISHVGTSSFFQCFLAEKNANGDLVSEINNLIDENNPPSLKAKYLYGMKNDAETRCLYLPLLRCLYLKFPQHKQPVFHHFAQYNGCQLMQNSLPTPQDHNVIGNMEGFGGSKALFVTNVAVTFRLDDNSYPGSAGYLNSKEETLFELLDRNSKPYEYVKSSKVKPILRGGHNKLYIEETSLSPGNLIQYDFQKASKFINEYFKKDYYLNVEANLALYSVQPTDPMNAKITWKAMQGHKDHLTPYLLASTLYGPTELLYQDEVKKLTSRAIHNKNVAAQSFLECNFPL